ncbi:hypothetical protein [Nonomuraea recticatena]|uniref:Uncharacterized protein n=1 Tax=Nonomuraea recticatena TaxID=46178 RepID=A0ABN3TGW4_9ACTN
MFVHRWAHDQRDGLAPGLEVMIEREANTPHGLSIDAVREFEPLPTEV